MWIVWRKKAILYGPVPLEAWSVSMRHPGIRFFYNRSNSGLPGQNVHAIALDGSGNMWFGTGGGLAKFDGTNWTVYSVSNSGLPDNSVYSMAIDGSGNKWIGTNRNLSRFDGTNWTIFNTSDSGLPNNTILSLAIDGSGNKWIGTFAGLAVYHEGGVVSTVDAADYRTAVPDRFVLSQNFPNPFNPETSIQYNISAGGRILLRVYDAAGACIRTLVDERQLSGRHDVRWDGCDANGTRMQGGIYFTLSRMTIFLTQKRWY